METKRTIKAGWGYWDVTSYPYGGDFHRTSEDTEVIVLGPGGKYPEMESKVRFANGRLGVVTNAAFASSVKG